MKKYYLHIRTKRQFSVRFFLNYFEDISEALRAIFEVEAWHRKQINHKTVSVDYLFHYI